MKTKERIYHKINPTKANIKNPDSPLFRKILGLPDLYDTDHNCIPMHNAKIENEVEHIDRKMGSDDISLELKRAKNAQGRGIDSKFGF